MNKQMDRILLAAEAFIAGNKSDPFARGRVMSHIANGVAGLDKDGRPDYSAVAGTEERRTAKGDKYKVVVFREMSRP